MAEKEYIEREAFRRRVKTHTNPYGNPTIDYESGVKVLQMIDTEPAADVVEVVRCKDCSYCEERHYEEDGEKPYIKLACKWSNYSHLPNDFCSYGERRKDELSKATDS